MMGKCEGPASDDGSKESIELCSHGLPCHRSKVVICELVRAIIILFVWEGREYVGAGQSVMGCDFPIVVGTCIDNENKSLESFG